MIGVLQEKDEGLYDVGQTQGKLNLAAVFIRRKPEGNLNVIDDYGMNVNRTEIRRKAGEGQIIVIAIGHCDGTSKDDLVSVFYAIAELDKSAIVLTRLVIIAYFLAQGAAGFIVEAGLPFCGGEVECKRDAR
jgi:hypothetical protein